MMRFLGLSSIAALFVFFTACGHPYKHLQSVATDESVLAFKPRIERELYRCVVDGRFLLKKFHLSGVLLFKSIEDGSTRVVFQNEMGFAFFDFMWDRQESFTVVSAIEQLNKPAVIKTLQRDIELVLMNGLSAKAERHYVQAGDTLSRFPFGRGAAWYKVQKGSLRLIDYVGKSKVTTIDLQDPSPRGELPPTIYIRHHKAHFTINLKKLSKDEG